QLRQQPKYAAVDSKQVISQLILLFSVQITQNLVPEMTKTTCTRQNSHGLCLPLSLCCTQTHTGTHTGAHTQTHMHTCTHTRPRTHTRTHTHTHKHTHTQAHTRTHTHTCTHTTSQCQPCCFCVSSPLHHLL